MKENIADVIREDHRPEGEMMNLAGEARRLRSSLAVAERWLEVAQESDEVGYPGPSPYRSSANFA